MRMSVTLMVWLALCAVSPLASAWQLAPGPGAASASVGAAAIQPPPSNLTLELAPVQGLTTAWHVAPDGFSLPVGEIAYLRQAASPGMTVVWHGADELSRTEEYSLAGVPLTELGFHEVLVELYPAPLGDGQVPSGFHWTHGCVIAATDAPLAQTTLGDIAAAVPLADLGEQTVGSDGLALYFADESIADLTTLRDGWYATSIKRLVQMEVVAEDEALMPLIEWRVDGEAIGLGAANQLRFLEPGAHLVEAGPPGNAAVIRVEAYSVEIVRKWPADGWPDGAPMTFLAETDPPGFEAHIRWLAADKLGVPTQVTATGPVFTTTFDGSYGPVGNQQAWMGVKADSAYLGADTNCNPQPSMLYPIGGEVLTGSVALAVDQIASCVDDGNLDRVRFEASDDGGQSWTLIHQVTGDALLDQADLGTFEGRWDTTAFAPGSWDVRSTMRLPGEAPQTSAPVTILVNAAPQPSASATATGNPGEVTFDATSSLDPDGSIINYLWDFGDGSTGSGPIITHTYGDTGIPYGVYVETTDNNGVKEYQYYVMSFLAPSVIEWILENNCICISMELRGDDPGETAALGPDAAPGGSTWPAWKDGFDGKTLGKSHSDPGNGTVGGEKNRTGFGFEVVATVFGNPKKCPEIQLVKASIIRPGVAAAACTAAGGIHNAGTGECEYPLGWTGTDKDLDVNGTTDLDVSTKAMCENPPVNGKWDGSKCTIKYPQSGTKYRPDEYKQGEPGGAYESAFSFKKHVGNKIIWFDVPGFTGAPNGTKLKGDFVAIVRGTDGKACYMKYSYSAEKKAGVDAESLTLTDSSAPGGVVNIPGVP
jgi:hypothetical protein